MCSRSKRRKSCHEVFGVSKKNREIISDVKGGVAVPTPLGTTEDPMDTRPWWGDFSLLLVFLFEPFRQILQE